MTCAVLFYFPPENTILSWLPGPKCVETMNRVNFTPKWFDLVNLIDPK